MTLPLSQIDYSSLHISLLVQLRVHMDELSKRLELNAPVEIPGSIFNPNTVMLQLNVWFKSLRPNDAYYTSVN